MSDQHLPDGLLGAEDSVGNLAPHLPEYKDDPPHATLAMALARAVRCGTEGWQDKFADVTIEVGGRTFRSYRLVLSAYSEYFHGMFSSNMKEAAKQHVALEGVSAEVFELILKMIFESRNLLTEGNVFDVWHVADMYQVSPVVELCKDFLTQNVNFNNCFDIYKNANQLSNKSLVEFSLAFILDNFCELRKLASTEADFLDLSFEDMRLLVRSQKLNSQSEDEVIKLVLDWVCKKSSENDQNNLLLASDSSASEPESRSKHVHNLLADCRLMVESCTWSCLQEAVTRLAHIQDVDVGKSKDLLSQCISWKFKGHMKHDGSSVWSSNRDHHSNVNAKVYVSNPTRTNVVGIAVLLANERSFRKYSRTLGRAISSAIWNDQLFLIIDTSVGNVAPCFDIFCCSLICDLVPVKVNNVTPVNGAEVGMAVVNNKVYIVGDVTKEGLVPIGPLHIHFVRPPVDMKDLTVTTSDSTIVMFGSQVSSDQDGVTVIQCFDTEKNIHYQIDDIIGSPKHLCAFPTETSTLFLLSNGSLWKLIADGDKLKSSHLGMLWTQRRHLVGAIIIKGVLVISHKAPNLTWPKSFQNVFSCVQEEEFFFRSESENVQVEMVQILQVVLPRSSFMKTPTQEQSST